MKKTLFTLATLILAVAFSYGEKANRGSLENVTAESIRAANKTVVAQQNAQQQKAPQQNAAPATTIIAVEQVEVVEVPAQNAKATAATPQAQPAQSQAGTQAMPPVFAVDYSNAKPYLTQFGKTWASVGAGGGGIFNSGDNKSQKLGANAIIEGSLSILSFDNDKYGLNLALPLEFKYWSLDAKTDSYNFNFPLVARPYYRFEISDNFTITPFGDFGAGGSYNYYSAEDSSDKSLAFLWSVGAGVEFSFMQDFSLTPKYQWVNEEDGGSAYTQKLACEFAWRFAERMSLVADYNFYIYKAANIYEHTGIVKVRFDF